MHTMILKLILMIDIWPIINYHFAYNLILKTVMKDIRHHLLFTERRPFAERLPKR